MAGRQSILVQSSQRQCNLWHVDYIGIVIAGPVQLEAGGLHWYSRCRPSAVYGWQVVHIGMVTAIPVQLVAGGYIGMVAAGPVQPMAAG